MRIAIYARISKTSSDLNNQLLLLREYCKSMDYKIYNEYTDVISGASANRTEFNKMMSDASKRKFDMVLFYALDRFSREGARRTIYYLQMLDEYSVKYKSYTEQYIDSSGLFADVIIALLSTLAKQERIRISERVHAGLARAKLAGRTGGRPTLEALKIDKIRELKSGGTTVTEISQKLSISRGTVYRYLLY